MSNVGDYQSAVQLVVGANLAFFTFPELRQPSLPRLELELGHWAKFLQTVPAIEPDHDTVRAGELEVRNIRRAVENRLAGVRSLCLAIAATYALLLLWMCHAASRPTDGLLLEAASILGALPAVVVAYLNSSVSRSVVTARFNRQRLEAALIRSRDHT
ncbi:MAG TPA: hypothetical protein VME47_15515 [Acetobacteraceae bacterium]|nr:hypothetical protein [Acetobacteraceae bacterium]